MKKRQGKIASGKRGKRQAVDRSLHPVVRLLNCRDYIRSGDERIHPDDWPGYTGSERWVAVDASMCGQKYSPRAHPPIRRQNAHALAEERSDDSQQRRAGPSRPKAPALVFW